MTTHDRNTPNRAKTQAAPQTDVAAIEDFLAECLQLGGDDGPKLVQLSAIAPDARETGEPPRSRTFADAAQAADWAAEKNANWNVYFVPAEPANKLQRRVNKTDIARIWVIPADLDPLKDMQQDPTSLRTWRDEALPKIKARLKQHGIHADIISTGGGFCILAPLAKAFEIETGDDEARAEDLIARFHALFRDIGKIDGTHDVVHLMRLPGTVNYPSPKKANAGRETASAEWIADDCRTNALAVFETLPKAEKAGGSQAVKIKGGDLDFRNERYSEGYEPTTIKQACKANPRIKSYTGNAEKGDNSADAFAFMIECIKGVCLHRDAAALDHIADPNFRIECFDVCADYLHAHGEDQLPSVMLSFEKKGCDDFEAGLTVELNRFFRDKQQYLVEVGSQRALQQRMSGRIATKLAAKEDDEPLEISPELEFETNLTRMLKRYALLEEGRGNDVYVADLTCIGEKGWTRTRKKFESRYQNISREGETPSGTPTIIPITKDFFSSPFLQAATRLEFAPDKPEGFRMVAFRGGVTDGVINTYVWPQHPVTGGEAETFHTFIKHLLPVKAQRERFIDSLAAKVQNPAIRGPVVVMVAAGVYGAGRGLLQQILERLHGEQLVIEKPFGEYCGIGTPGQWTDWLEGKLYVCVAEMRDADRGGSHYDKRAAYEHIKRIGDPSLTRFNLSRRGVDSYSASVYATSLLFTNHADALLIEEGDRRLDVYENGEAATVEMREAVLAWMRDPANIGALWRELQGRGVAKYDPNAAPPMTEAKKRMIELNRSPIDAALNEFRTVAAENEIEIVTRDMIKAFITRRLLETGEGDANDPKGSERMLAAIHRAVFPLPRGSDRAGSGDNRVVVVALANSGYWAKVSNGERTAAYRRASEIFEEPSVTRGSNVIRLASRRNAG